MKKLGIVRIENEIVKSVSHSANWGIGSIIAWSFSNSDLHGV